MWFGAPPAGVARSRRGFAKDTAGDTSDDVSYLFWSNHVVLLQMGGHNSDHSSAVAYPKGFGGEGSNAPPPPKFRRKSKIVPNPIVKTVKKC